MHGFIFRAAPAGSGVPSPRRVTGSAPATPTKPTPFPMLDVGLLRAAGAAPPPPRPAGSLPPPAARPTTSPGCTPVPPPPAAQPVAPRKQAALLPGAAASPPPPPSLQAAFAAVAAPRSCPERGRPPRAPGAARSLARVRVRRALDLDGRRVPLPRPAVRFGGGVSGAVAAATAAPAPRPPAARRKRADTPGWPPRVAARRRDADDAAAGLVARLQLGE